ncbi:MAG: MtaA/CmuA family methyltransferase [Candidatus Abyssobacteria bacterium SURF_17]|uniref:MtaA/CmuA family methyltransferase n=1 Tax=Candidatus Abyssobacteria bacterium SURF_17 TaxID=2093361 RepID=A0A419EYT7_9BACT|nr:MAG: MtaA/CmuA family methyltransferase [Candidatus Abyssubacteria bacterium SURF_17]
MSVGKTSREKVLELLNGKRNGELLCFSGMGNVTTEGMKQTGIRFAESHTDASKMAALAATTHKLFGFECAVIPFDVAIEAEIVGCPINFYTRSHPLEILYPTVKEKVIRSAGDIKLPSDLSRAGRVPLVTEALNLLSDDLKGAVAIGTYIMGPFTIAGQTMELSDLLKISLKKPEEVAEVLAVYTELVIQLAETYSAAGADYITIREMGACSDVLRPALFKQLVEPQLRRIFDQAPHPLVLHICGKSNGIMDSMNRVGAGALSVDQKNDLRETRKTIGPKPILLGNFDPFNILVKGTPSDVKRAVQECVNGGVDAVWPGCDIWPTVPTENMNALMQAVKNARKGRN